MASRYIIPTLAVISGVYAQCTASVATTTITNAAAITGCSTYSGSIALATSIAGDIDLSGIEEITGSLIGNSVVNMTSLTGTTLQTVGGNFTLASGTILNYMNFPALSSVGGLSLTALGPHYQQLGFGNLSSVGSLTLIDTFLQSLSGITLTEADSINIAQNQYLSSIDMSTLRALTGTLSITANANGQATASFSNLTTASSITVQNVSSLTLPALNNVTGGMYITANNFASLILSNLQSTNDLTVDNNDAMTNFSVPQLSSINGALNFWNNTDYTGAVSFPSLTSVTGSAYIVGDFSSLSMPELNTVQGVVNINSTQDISSTCSHFTPLKGNVVHGSVQCNTGSSAASPSSIPSGTSGSSPSSTSGSGSSSSTTGAAMSTFQPSQASAFTVFGLLAAVFGLLM